MQVKNSFKKLRSGRGAFALAVSVLILTAIVVGLIVNGSSSSSASSATSQPVALPVSTSTTSVATTETTIKATTTTTAKAEIPVQIGKAIVNMTRPTTSTSTSTTAPAICGVDETQVGPSSCIKNNTSCEQLNGNHCPVRSTPSTTAPEDDSNHGGINNYRINCDAGGSCSSPEHPNAVPQ